MGQTTNYQLPYPEGAQPVHEGAKNMRDLATRADAVLTALAAKLPASLSTVATKAWVTAQGFASAAAVSGVIRGWTGSALRADGRIIAGSSVGVVSGFGTVSIPIPGGWNPAGWVFSAIVSNGDASAAQFYPQVFAMPAQNTQAATTLVVLVIPTGKTITAGTSVRINWLLVGA